MVKFNNLGDLLETFLELLDLGRRYHKAYSILLSQSAYLLKVIAKLDDGRRAEQTLFVDDELSVFERINIALDE